MFIGRKFELSQLAIFFKRSIAGLAVCCGRRRIGKSTLIAYAARDRRFLEFYGLPPREGSTKKHQLQHFAVQLSQYFQLGPLSFNDWDSALAMLASLTQQGEFIILLDEISWMAIGDRDFPGKLKGVWDTRLKLNPDLK